MGIDFTPLVIMAVMFMGAAVGFLVTACAVVASIWLDVPALWYWLPPMVGAVAGAVYHKASNR